MIRSRGGFEIAVGASEVGHTLLVNKEQRTNSNPAGKMLGSMAPICFSAYNISSTAPGICLTCICHITAE